MPFDSNGNYTLPDTYFVENGDTVLPIQHNPSFEDVAQALSSTMLRSGVAPMTGELKMGTKKVTGMGDGTATTDAVTKGQLDTVSSAVSAIQPGYLYGLTVTNNAVDTANDIDISSGAAADDSPSAVIMKLGATLTKRIDAAWAVGTSNGGLDTGAVVNGVYYVWLIQRSDTSVVDALISLSNTAPTMPANYDRKRLLPWVLTRSGGVNLLSRTDKAWELIEDATVSGIASWARTGLSAFRELRLKFYGYPDAATTVFQLQFSTTNGSTWLNGASDYFYQYILGSTTSPTAGSASSSSIPLSISNNVAVGPTQGGIEIDFTIVNFNKSHWARLLGPIGLQTNSSALFAATMFGGQSGIVARDALRIVASTNFTGRIILEGIRG